MKLATALLTPLAVLALAVPMALAAPASAAPSASPLGKPLKCFASDGSDVRVDKRANSVAITDDPTTGGNNFGCLTNISVMAGDTITFDHDTTCGGGVPRVFVRFAGDTGENTFDTGTCVAATTTTLGTVTYTLRKNGTITSFAFINDRLDGGTVTYSNLVIDGNRIDF